MDVESGSSGLSLPGTTRRLRPIFILGMMRRTGTNYLSDLLTLHPDCAKRPPLWEDYLLMHAEHLVAYADALSHAWPARWKVPAEERGLLLERIGDGLTAFLGATHPDRRTVTKTPNVRNLESFFSLFPAAYLLVVVRDGRSVAESSVKSRFHRTYESAIQDWAAAGRVVLDFDEAHRASAFQYRIVRYEDLLDVEHGVRPILEFCGLDVDRYDFDVAARLPVRGSSTVRTGPHDDVHWAPVAKSEEFQPTQRWTSWDERRHRRFNEIAGEVQRGLGYETEPVGDGGVGAGLLHAAHDVGWLAHRTLRKLKGSLKR